MYIWKQSIQIHRDYQSIAIPHRAVFEYSN